MCTKVSTELKVAVKINLLSPSVIVALGKGFYGNCDLLRLPIFWCNWNISESWFMLMGLVICSTHCSYLTQHVVYHYKDGTEPLFVTVIINLRIKIIILTVTPQYSYTLYMSFYIYINYIFYNNHSNHNNILALH